MTRPEPNKTKRKKTAALFELEKEGKKFEKTHKSMNEV